MLRLENLLACQGTKSALSSTYYSIRGSPPIILRKTRTTKKAEEQHKADPLSFSRRGPQLTFRYPQTSQERKKNKTKTNTELVLQKGHARVIAMIQTGYPLFGGKHATLRHFNFFPLFFEWLDSSIL